MDWKKFKRKNVCLLLHEHADLDALGSAMALQSYLLRVYNVKSRIYAKSLNSLSKSYVEMHAIDVENVKDNLSCDLAVLIDIATIKQLGFELKAKEIVVFDHHISNNIITKHKYVKPYSSTARVVYEYIINVNGYESQHLLAALLYDTSFLRYADIGDLDVVKDLLIKAKATLNDYWFIREHALNVEKEAKRFLVHAIENANVISWSDKKVVISKVGSYESKVASIFLQLGFDAALIFSLKKNEARLSCRFNDKVFADEEIKSLIDIIAKTLDMECGGHKYVVYCKGKTMEKNKIFNILKRAMV